MAWSKESYEVRYKMDLKTILIIILIGFIIFTYYKPDQGLGMIEQGVGKTKTLIGELTGSNPFFGSEECDHDVEAYVCGNDGTTYKNECFAKKNNVYTYVEGRCE